MLTGVLASGLAWASTPVTKATAKPVRPETRTKQAADSAVLAADVGLGRRLYVEGVLADGQPLVGHRSGNLTLRGQAAACVHCHRPSGLGGREGDDVVPPISGAALFGKPGAVNVEVDQRASRGLIRSTGGYDGKSFADAVRQGKQVGGRSMHTLMPRFAMADRDINNLMAYLQTLSSQWSPGASANDIHLATVITPEVSAERRQALIATLRAMVMQHSVNVHAGGHHKIPAIERRMHSQRTWSLDVWELTGPSSGWREQLDAKQRQNPAFAIVSGVSDTEWQPVQDFCEASRVACWLPTVDVTPASAVSQQFGLYFSDGMRLEGQVVADKLRQAKSKSGKVLQLVSADNRAQALAATIEQSLVEGNLTLQTLNWSEGSIEAVRAQLAELRADQDHLLLWLNDADSKRLLETMPAPVTPVYWSSTLLHSTLPEAWKPRSWLVDRFEHAKLRDANLARFRDWIKFRKLALVDERLQSEAFFAMNAFGWMSATMLNNLYSDYLIERAEAELGMRDAMQVQEEVNSMMMGGGGRRPMPAGNLNDPGSPAHMADIDFLRQRQSISVYPRLSLGNGQRLASKGAFIRPLLVTDSENNGEWVIPASH